MMLTASHNAYFSYDYNWILSEKNEPIDEKTAAGILRVQALKDWASSRIIQVSLLGIRVSVDDAAVLGTLVLFVLSVWLLLVSRRENYTIGFLLRDTDTSPAGRFVRGGERSKHPDPYTDEQRWRIFHAILVNSIFMTVNPSLSRFKSLRINASPGRLMKSSLLRKTNYWAFMIARGFFFMFPVIASLIVFGIDRYSYSIPDPFEPNAQVPGFQLPFFSYSLWIYLACWLPLTLCCWRTGQYLVATEQVLQEYGSKLRQDLLQAAKAPQYGVASETAPPNSS
jgi:hypothetical protein